MSIIQFNYKVVKSVFISSHVFFFKKILNFIIIFLQLYNIITIY
jgi:hypothetical protein